MDDTMPVEEKRTISRRAVIAGGAVGAAAFWSVPVLTSVPAAAATGSGAVAFPCSWAVIVYVQITGNNVDNYTYFVNGWSQGGSCSQGNIKKCAAQTGDTWLTNAGSPISVEFDGNTHVIITDTGTSMFLSIDLTADGGSGTLTTGGVPTGSCSQGVLTNNSGTTFSVPSGYAILAALGFQGCVADFPPSSGGNPPRSVSGFCT
jgi:hypothetical protein